MLRLNRWASYPRQNCPRTDNPAWHGEMLGPELTGQMLVRQLHHCPAPEAADWQARCTCKAVICMLGSSVRLRWAHRLAPRT
jgi:hypothetical protein